MSSIQIIEKESVVCVPNNATSISRSVFESILFESECKNTSGSIA